jgi:hypothetical protein
MPHARFSLPEGYTYNDLRQFLEAELQEDFGGRDAYLWLRDFDDATVTYSGNDSALYQRTYTIASGDVTWGQPTEVTAKTTYVKVAEMAAFSIGDGTDDGEFVIRRGKVFEIGEYPDKAFSLTADEAKAVVAAFTPVPNDIEHRPSILDGKLGELRAVEMAEDGTSLMGTVAIPKWLNDTIGGAALKVSLAFDRATKRIAKNGLVLNPRVADAALFGAYAEFAGKRHNKADQDAVQAVHDHAVSLGATCPASAQMSKEPGMTDTKAPTRMEKFMAWLAGEGEGDTAQFAADPPKAEAPKVDAVPDPEKVALMARIAAMEKERLAERAAVFADAEIAAKRALPAEKASLIAAFTDAADDDAAHPRTVTFAVGTEEKTGTRVDALKARFAARPPHVLTEELLTDADAQALFNNRSQSAKPGEMTAERRKELLAKTALGQTIIATK